MNVSGEFATSASPAALLRLRRDPAWLARVPALRDVTVTDHGTVRTVFSPVTPLGPVPLRMAIVVEHADTTGARLRVNASRGAQAVDVDLRLGFREAGDATQVSWTAEVRVRGAAASVGQRVAGDIARRAIADVLQHAADSAGRER